MARIRTIKPEFPHSESMGRISREARLTFILIWTLCDDEGRTRGGSRILASLLFPYDEDVRGSKIEKWLGELETERCVIRYEVEGNSYLQVCNWLSHQKIDRPSKSRIPEPREDSRVSRDDSRAFVGGSKDLDLDQDLDQDRDLLCTDVPKAERSVPDDSPAIMEFPCNGPIKTWQLRQSLVDKLKDAYPNLDIVSEAKKALAWVHCNPRKAKTAKGMPRTLNIWMQKANDSPHRGNGASIDPEEKERLHQEALTKLRAKRAKEREQLATGS